MLTDFEKALEVLNSAYKADPMAIHSLMCSLVPCQGKELMEHPEVVVAESNVSPGNYHVTSLGLINGILYSMTGRRVAMNWSDNKDGKGRCELLGFVEYIDQIKPENALPPIVDVDKENKPFAKILQGFPPPPRKGSKE